MKRIQIALSVVLAVLVVFGLSAAPAKAMKQFRDGFVAKYVKADSSEAKDKEFAAAVEKAKCNVCHEGESKKQRNVYGKAVAKFLEKKDKDDKEKITTGLEKAAAEKCNPKDDKSATFGDLIKQGKLPCGEPKAESTAAR
jgi:hypothetical protein